MVKAGDNIVLYTGSGTPIKRPRPDGGTDHFVYWNMPGTIWNNIDDCAVLVEITTWQTSAFGM
jgi:hypothetical protein